MKTQLIALLVAGVSVLSAGVSKAQDGSGRQAVQAIIIDQNDGQGYFSSRLGARFQIDTYFLPGFGHYRGAKLTTMPVPGSPLAQANLQLGDVITRLDGIPVQNNRSLENHHLDTNVRFVKAGSHRVGRASIWIEPERFFHAPDCLISQRPGLRP